MTTSRQADGAPGHTCGPRPSARRPSVLVDTRKRVGDRLSARGGFGALHI